MDHTQCTKLIREQFELLCKGFVLYLIEYFKQKNKTTNSIFKGTQLLTVTTQFTYIVHTTVFL